jgi:hypothetical protein
MNEKMPILVLRKNKVAKKIFTDICHKWGLNEQHSALLLNPNALKHNVLSNDSIIRISHLIAIYKALFVLAPEGRNGWIKKPNDKFNGKSALYIMTRDLNGIIEVRNYLDSQFH